MGLVLGIAAGAGAAAAGASVAVAVAVGVAAVAVMDYVIDQATPDAYTPQTPSDTMSSRNITAKNSTAPREIVYGQTRKGGTIIFQHVHGSDVYTDADEIYGMIIAWHHGEAEAINKIYFGDEVVWQGGNYKGQFASNGSSSPTGNNLYIANRLGTSTQSAETTTGTASTWTTNHRLRGITYSRMELTYDNDLYPNGAPKVTAEIKGRKVYDPRDSSQVLGTESTWKWSDNPVLCLLDYLKKADRTDGTGTVVNKDWGADLPIDLFDMTQISTAADYCDATFGSGNKNRKRYSCNGVINTQSTVKENIQNLLSCMQGRLLFINGKFHILPYKYNTPHSTVLNEDMIIGDFVVSNTNPRKVAFNEVRGEYVNKDSGYIKTEYPPQRSSAYQADDDDSLRKNLNLPFTTDIIQAQRLANLALLKSRMQKTLKTTINARGIDYAVGDNIYVTNSALAITNNVYEITSLRLQVNESGITIDLEARENAPQIYNADLTAEKLWTTGVSANLPFQSKATRVDSSTLQINAVPVLDGNKFYTGIAISWEHPPATNLNYYAVRIIEATSSETLRWEATNTTSNTITIPNKTGQSNIKVSIITHGINQTPSDELVVNFNNGLAFSGTSDLPVVIYGDPSITPTTADYEEYFGRPPVEGDELTVVELDSDGNAIDARVWIYNDDIQLYTSHLNSQTYIQSKESTQSVYQNFAVEISPTETNGVTPTFTRSVSNFESNVTLSSPTISVKNLGLIDGNYSYRIDVAINSSQYSSLNPVNDKSLPVSEQIPVDVAYVKYNVTVTANWIYNQQAAQRQITFPVILNVTGYLD